MAFKKNLIALLLRNIQFRKIHNSFEIKLNKDKVFAQFNDILTQALKKEAAR